MRIDSALREQLITLSRVRRTTLALTVFTAYAALVLRWSKVSEAVLQFETDGRSSHTLEKTVGYLASTLLLRIELKEHDTFADLIDRVAIEYRGAQEHADLGYVAAQMPRPGFACNAAFNWIPQKSKVSLQDPTSDEHALICTPLRFTHPLLKVDDRDNEPVLMLYDRDEGLEGGIHFSASRLSQRRMERFGAQLRVFLSTLTSGSDVKIRDITLS